MELLARVTNAFTRVWPPLQLEPRLRISSSASTRRRQPQVKTQGSCDIACPSRHRERGFARNRADPYASAMGWNVHGAPATRRLAHRWITPLIHINQGAGETTNAMRLTGTRSLR